MRLYKCIAAASVLAALLLIISGAYPFSSAANSSDTDTYGSIGAISDADITESTEVRGVYIATVQNINYPSKQGLNATTLASELDNIVATAKAANLNAIYFQVRPCGDALYKSDIFPPSEYVTGEQGNSFPENFDSLEYLINVASENDIAVHAWVNPLRVTVGSQSMPEHNVQALAVGHPARENPEYVIPYADGRLYFDCGQPEVRELIAESVAEIARGYNVASVIFDDYFYPYPVRTTDGKIAVFDDGISYAAYGGGMTIDDWRRDNVNKMIEECYNAIKSANPSCEFGVAPFGIWQNDNGVNGGSATSGLESYSAIYCDPTAWVRGGYIDYLAPQIYWRFDTAAARYDVLADWWGELLDAADAKLLISHGIYNYDVWEDPENELFSQVEFARKKDAYCGSILYGYAALKSNTNGLFDEVCALFDEDTTIS